MGTRRTTAAVAVLADDNELHDIRAEFAEALVRHREALGLSQGAFAQALNLSQSAVSQWEMGRSSPLPGTVFAIEALLELAPGTLTRTLGYLPVPKRGVSRAVGKANFVTAVEEDPRLDNRARRMLLAMYRELVRPD